MEGVSACGPFDPTVHILILTVFYLCIVLMISALQSCFLLPTVSFFEMNFHCAVQEHEQTGCNRTLSLVYLSGSILQTLDITIIF